MFFAVNGPVVHPLIPADFPSFIAGDHTISFCPAYIPMQAPLPGNQTPGFSTGKIPASYAFADAVALKALARLSLGNTCTQQKHQGSCYK